MINRILTGLALMTLTLAAACSGKDNRKAANDIDPAVTNALEDQIMVDPNLVGQANRFGRTPSTGSQAPIPDTAAGGPTVAPGKLMHTPKPGAGKASGAVKLGQMAKEQPGSASCDQQIEYSTPFDGPGDSQPGGLQEIIEFPSSVAESADITDGIHGNID